jgi:vitamin B12 transporter
VDADQGAYQDDNNAFTEFDRNLYSYGANAELSEQLNLEFTGAYSDLQRNFVNDSSLVSPNSYDGIYTETNAEGSLWENELKAIAKGEYTRLVVGASASRQTMSTRNYTFSSQFGGFESTTDLDSLNLQEVIYNGYIHTNFNGGLLASSMEPISLVLGARYVNHDEFGSHFTYEINPKVQLSPSALIYGAITSGFNAPSLYQLYSPSQSATALTNRGNQNLDPEKSVSYELGWKQQVSSAFSFELSAFKTEVRDVIEYIYLWNGNSAGSIGAGDYLGDTYINASQQDVMGVELSAAAYPVDKLQLQGNISLTRSSLTFGPDDISRSYTGGNLVQIYESGQFVTEEQEIEGLTRRPSVNAFVSATYEATDRLRLNLDSQFVGARDDVFYSSNLGPYGALDRSNVDGYNLTDIGIRYEISRQFSVTGKVENLFDTDYQEINGYNTRGRGMYLKASFSL